MTRGETASRWMLVAGLTVALTASSGRGYAEAAEPTPGAWTGGAALGFLGNTDDRTAFAMNLNVERFLNRSFSVGPLLQFGVTGNLTQIGVSGQVKYWVNLSKALKLTAQGGLGFMHTDVPGSGTSLLVPLGVGFDYALNRNVSATATFDGHPRRDRHAAPGGQPATQALASVSAPGSRSRQGRCGASVTHAGRDRKDDADRSVAQVRLRRGRDGQARSSLGPE